MRVNWLGIIVATIVLFFFGWLWYHVFFGAMWKAEMATLAPTAMAGVSANIWYPMVVAVVMSFFLAYGLARILGWRGDWSVGRGAFIGVSMGLLIFGSMTWMDYAFSGFGATLGWVNIGFVAVGMGIQGVVLSLMKPQA